MLVRPKHFEWNFKKHGARKKVLEEAVRKGEISSSEAKYFLSRDNFSPFFDEAPADCSFCGKTLKIPAVMWHLYESAKDDHVDIWWHLKCAEGFAQKLMRDVNEFEYGKEAADVILKVWKRKYER